MGKVITINGFICIIIAIQLALLGLISFAAIGYDIPVVRSIIGFIYLTFVPGLLIIKNLKFRDLNYIETALYSVGLSLVSVTLLGLFISFLYPYLGISKPFSINSLIITITIFVVILCFLTYKRNHNNFVKLTLPAIKEVPLNLILISVLLPLLSVSGTLLFRYYDNNIILLFLILLISAAIVFAVFSKSLGVKSAYPLLLWSITLSLLFISVFISNHIFTGGDTHAEIPFLKLTVANLYWQPLPGVAGTTLNDMLCITILPAIYSIIMDIGAVETVKIIYTFFLSLVPIGLYQFYSTQTNKLVAFIAACFFITQHSFYGLLTVIGSRMMIAALFFVLLMLITFKNEQNVSQKILLIIFSIGLIVSHYATAYLWMIYISIFWLLIKVLSQFNLTKDFAQRARGVNGTYIYLFIVMTFFWYIYSSGAPFDALIGGYLKSIVSGLSEFFVVETRESVVLNAVGSVTTGWLGEVKRWVYLTAIFFIIIGCLGSFFKYLRYRGLDFNESYSLSSLIFLSLIVAHVILPKAGAGYGTWRAYLQSLFFLSPFFVSGGYIIFELITKPIKINKEYTKVIFVIILLLVHALFQVGFIDTVAGRRSTYYLDTDSRDSFIIRDTDDSAAKWLSSYGVKSAGIYRDRSQPASIIIAHTGVFWRPKFQFFADDAYNTPWCRYPYVDLGDLKYAQDNNAYVFWGYVNVVKAKALVFNESGKVYESKNFKNAVIFNNMIYGNGAAQIFR